ncbi:uncharacterized protein ACNS7B_008026 [Menidia menidia]
MTCSWTAGEDIKRGMHLREDGAGCGTTLHRQTAAEPNQSDRRNSIWFYCVKPQPSHKAAEATTKMCVRFDLKTWGGTVDHSQMSPGWTLLPGQCRLEDEWTDDPAEHLFCQHIFS